MPDRPQLRPDHALLVAGADPASAVLLVKMTVHLDPPGLIVHALRQAQHLRHAAVDGIGKLIGTAGDRAPAEVEREHARRIRPAVSRTATQLHASCVTMLAFAYCKHLETECLR